MIAISPMFEADFIDRTLNVYRGSRDALNTAKNYWGKKFGSDNSETMRTKLTKSVGENIPQSAGGVGGVMRKIVSHKDALARAAANN